jgi:integrase
MRREHLDFGWKGGRRLIKTPAGKRGKAGGIAMTARLRAVLMEHLKTVPRKCPWVFPYIEDAGPIDYDRVCRAFKHALKNAGLTGLRPYDLRHGFATRLGALGATQAEIQNCLRQRTPWMMDQYAHLGEEHTAAAASKLDQSVTRDTGAHVVEISKRS